MRRAGWNPARPQWPSAPTGSGPSRAGIGRPDTRPNPPRPELARNEEMAVERERAGEAALQAAEEQRGRADGDQHRWEAREEALAQALDRARAGAGVERLAGLDGVVGTLMELVDVDAGFEPAFEAAAGEVLAAVFLDSPRAARRGLEELHRLDRAGAVVALSPALPAPGHAGGPADSAAPFHSPAPSFSVPGLPSPAGPERPSPPRPGSGCPGHSGGRRPHASEGTSRSAERRGLPRLVATDRRGGRRRLAGSGGPGHPAGRTWSSSPGPVTGVRRGLWRVGAAGAGATAQRGKKPAGWRVPPGRRPKRRRPPGDRRARKPRTPGTAGRRRVGRWRPTRPACGLRRRRSSGSKASWPTARASRNRRPASAGSSSGGWSGNANGFPSWRAFFRSWKARRQPKRSGRRPSAWPGSGWPSGRRPWPPCAAISRCERPASRSAGP